jgi:uncharacterized membrane protein YadS
MKGQAPRPADDVVVLDESPKKGFSELFKSEDYWAIWLGAVVLLIGLFLYVVLGPVTDARQKIDEYNAVMAAEAQRAPFKTMAWHQAREAKEKVTTRSESAKILEQYLARPGRWDTSPAASFYLSPEEAKAVSEANKPKFEAAQKEREEAEAKAKIAEADAAAAGYKDAALNAQAGSQIDAWIKAREAEAKAKKAAETKPYNHFVSLGVLCVALGLFFSIGMKIMGASLRRFLLGFPFVFLLAALAYFLAAQVDIRAWGLEYVLWAIIIGLLISNTVGTPKWVMPAVQTEYYIKTGLILLGASILFGKIILVGLPGLLITWVACPAVLIFTYWFGQRILKMESKTLNIVLSADMSVSGVSAAIATAAACRAKKEELTLAIGISIIFTSLMMFVMPAVAKAVGMHPVLAGAWMGGSIDSTGAVVAAGALLGNEAMTVAATIKMIQNILIGIVAFGVAAYWTTVVDRTRAGEVELTAGAAVREIWKRFPRFILGFLGASLVFSAIYQYLGPDMGKAVLDEGMIRGWSSVLQGWFFALAFVSIGLGTNFRELKKYLKGGKPVILYIVGQSAQWIITLVMAYLLFFVLFRSITDRLMM